jgi:hypothetical protein
MGLAGLAFAAAEWQENGTRVNKSEALNFVGGPDVSGNGTVTDVDFSTMTGDITVDGQLYVTSDIFVDSSIYMTTKNEGFYAKQPDNGCSRCGVDAAGTTWSCVDTVCPSGM